jgi:Zn-dependent M28 family amino/carboxypeptidase
MPVRVVVLLVLLAQSSSAVIDKTQLLADLKTLSADDMQGRRVDTPGGQKARLFIEQRFRASGIQPFGENYQFPFTFRSGRGANAMDRRGVNVVGRIVGTSDTERYIVVSAHYDHLGVQNGKVFHGADDNASGTAALFAIAQYFSTHRPAHSLIFAAFDAEETGLQGSREFVTHPPVSAASITLDINADMIARDNTLYVVGTFLQPFLKPGVDRIIAKAPAKTVIGHDNPSLKSVEDWTQDSDHYSFIQARIPALYFGVEDYAQHHKATDDYETIDPVFYAHAVETLILAVQEFDSNLPSLPK